MRPVTVVADTTHYLPRDVVAASGIQEVSLYVNWQGRQDREADLPDFDAYYEYLRTAGDLPTTSQPSVGDFLAVYEPLVAEAVTVALADRDNAGELVDHALLVRTPARGVDVQSERHGRVRTFLVVRVGGVKPRPTGDQRRDM